MSDQVRSEPQPAGRLYDRVMVMFVAMLLIANVAATKLIDLGPTWKPLGIPVLPLVFDGGAITYPITYLLSDVLAEVYGFAKARRAIVMGFIALIIATGVFFVVDLLPPDASWDNQAAWTSVLGLVPRIVLGSMAGYLAGQLINAKVLVWIKTWAKPGGLWFRLFGSTVVGKAADTLLFCTIAYAFIVDWGTLANYIVTGYLYGVAIEAILLPVTLRLIPWIKRREGL